MGDGWEEWSRYVLKELERLNSCYEGMNKRLTKMLVEITTLKVKAGMWGAIGALIPIISFVLIRMLMKKV